MPFEIVGDFALQVLAGLRPLFEKAVQLLDVDEEMIRRTQFRRRAGQRAHRIDQIRRTVCVAALVAAIAVLIGCSTFGIRTGASHEAVGQECPCDRIEQLSDGVLVDVPRAPQRGPNLVAEFAIGFAVRAAVVVELDVETGEVADVSVTHVGDQRGLAAAFLSSTNHDRRAVRVVGTDEDALVAAQLLKADPNVGLDVLDQMADVDVSVRVRQRGGHQNSTWRHVVSAGVPASARFVVLRGEDISRLCPKRVCFSRTSFGE